jgi:2,3-bisphosphoglycerate-dependent phosphoglycerate mutase
MITNIYFIRHANSTYTPEELKRPLSERGLKDANQVTKLLSKENITHVMSSPYKRSIQTVEGIANLFGLNISIDDGFRERKLADSCVDNFDEVILKYWEDFEFSLPGGETGYFAQDRGVKSLENTLDKYDGGNVVIGTHGNIMVLIMNYYDKKYNYDFWCNLNMPDIYKLSFENGKLAKAKRIWNNI